MPGRDDTRSIFFCTSYITDVNAWRTRYQRWLAFHRQFDFGDTRFVMIDDGGAFCPPEPVAQVIAPGTALPADGPAIIRFADRLGRHGVLSYPGWWRSFVHSLAVARQTGARKIIHVESDAFILSPRMRDYINGLDDGWTTFWATSYHFPETAIQVICEDQFETLEYFSHKAATELDGRFAEDLLPFTRINREMVGDRYSEFRIRLLRTGLLRSRKFNRLPYFQSNRFRARIPSDADFAAQVTPDQRLPPPFR